MIVLFYLIPLAFTVLFASYTHWQIADKMNPDPGPNTDNQMWHKMGLYMRITVGLSMIGWIYPPKNVGLDDLFLLATLMMPLFDIAINYFRGFPLLYTSQWGWDGKIGKMKWVLYAALLMIALYVKIN